MNAADYIHLLKLTPHPEGGYFSESYRSTDILTVEALPPGFTGGRSISTAIYYLLQQADYSSFHRIRSDECWHFYAGDTLLIHVIHRNGVYDCIKLGARLNEGERLQFVVPAGAWFAAEPAADSAFCLVGCTVAPGFDFTDFEMADKAALLAEFPGSGDIIKRLTR